MNDSACKTPTMTDIFQRNLSQKTASATTSLNGTPVYGTTTIPPQPLPQSTVIETKTPYSFDSPKSSVGFQITTPVQMTRSVASPDGRIGGLMQRVEGLEGQLRDVLEGVEERIQKAVYEAINGLDLHGRWAEAEQRIDDEAVEQRKIDEEDRWKNEEEERRRRANQKVWDDKEMHRRLMEERVEESEEEEGSVVLMPERVASVCGSVIERIEERIRETERKLR
jgi:hypothetical protein